MDAVAFEEGGNTPTGVGKTAKNCFRAPWSRKHPHGRGEDTICAPTRWRTLETPPRAWGRRPKAVRHELRHRNTPTGVGKTPCRPASAYRLQKHPHGRGEDNPSKDGKCNPQETPPRAWGRRNPLIANHHIIRNTPTGVGKTVIRTGMSQTGEKHPHGRGEDKQQPAAFQDEVETPPRAWGRPINLAAHPLSLGNTPTGVGKTFDRPLSRLLTRKHPHGRGEDELNRWLCLWLGETPPRAWGRLHGLEVEGVADGNTPTGVGKTFRCRADHPLRWKHPHGRGEDSSLTDLVFSFRETPPRAWGRLKKMPERFSLWGNTPTGVGKTAIELSQQSQDEKHPHGRGEDLATVSPFAGPWKHPHGRGEDALAMKEMNQKQETPPRAWGRQTKPEKPWSGVGNTPTGVGKTALIPSTLTQSKKHPHGRGEDTTLSGLDVMTVETPPRAWGRLSLVFSLSPSGGNTPTGVGKTGQFLDLSSGVRKHPHGRGEDAVVVA